MNDKIIGLDVCLIHMTDDELAILKLVAEAFVAMAENTELPRGPTETEQHTLLALFRRIKEM